MGVTERVPHSSFMCRLDFAFWNLAWDRYALAAAAVGQMPFHTATTYKHVITEVAINALAEGKSPQLAVVYDELARSVASCMRLSTVLLCVYL